MAYGDKEDSREAWNLIREEERNQRWSEGFSKMDSKILAEIPEEYLANLQAAASPDTAPHIRAQHEWNIRISKRQRSTAILASIIAGALGILGTLSGVIVGWRLAESKNYAEPATNSERQTSVVNPKQSPLNPP
jgi:hypothetical protein